MPVAICLALCLLYDGNLSGSMRDLVMSCCIGDLSEIDAMTFKNEVSESFVYRLISALNLIHLKNMFRCRTHAEMLIIQKWSNWERFLERFLTPLSTNFEANQNYRKCFRY